MLRAAVLIVLAVIAFVIWLFKAIVGADTRSLNDEIKTTVRKTSIWVDGLKSEWERGKKK